MPDNRSNAIVAGTFADFKIVKSRSVAQLVIELPLEKAQEAIEMFGVPMPGAEIWVAVARLVTNATPVVKVVDPSKSERARAEYAGKDKMAQAVARCSMLSKDPEFGKFLIARFDATTGEDMAAVVREILCIASRREISTDESAYRGWLDLEHQFAIYQGREPEPR